MTKHAQEQAKDRKLLICLPVWKKLNKKKISIITANFDEIYSFVFIHLFATV